MKVTRYHYWRDRVRDARARGKFLPRKCPEHFRPIVVLWKRTKMIELERQNMSAANKITAASIVWFEIPADNLERAKKFYSTLFGWKIAPFPGMPGPDAQNYLHIDTGGPDASPDGGMMKRTHPQQPITNYVSVPSVTEYMAKVGKLGGKVLVPKTAVMQMGYFAVCQDTESNVFALWERNKQAK
jgi:predicted enzyme related to lactoylglutathione lyase